MANTIEIVIKATDAASKVVANVESNVTDSTRAIVKNFDEVGKASQTAQQRIQDFGRGMAGLGDKLSVGVTLPLIAAGTAAIKFASDLNETTSKIGVLFGDMSDDIKKWADTSATSFGLSRKAALDGAADFAIFGKSAGLAGQNLSEFSKQNVKLASDMASFFNTSPEEAIIAIGAAFRGETEPIRRYGVLINDAALKDEALRQGLIRTSTEALTPQQRILAASALIMKQTSAAQGDFARTSDQLANSTRIAKAQLEDAAATLGTNLLPLINKGMNFVNGLLKAFQELTPEMQNAILAFGGIAAAIGPVMSVGGRLISLLPLMERGFLAIKAAGAAMSVSLGVIVAGLIAIAKYLGEVDTASKATTENLLEMSKSGDVFKQAAASTEILANGQNRLKQALDDVNSKLIHSNRTYDDYETSLRAAAKAAGFQIDAEGNLYTLVDEGLFQKKKVIQANYLLSDSQLAATKATDAAAQAASNQAFNQNLLNNAMLGTVQVQAEATSGGIALADSMGQQAQVAAATSKVISDNLQAQADAYNANIQRLADLRAAIGETISANANLAESLAKSTREQVKQQLATAAIEGLKEAYDNRTLSAEEYEKAVMAVQLRYGLATPASIAMAKAQSDLTDKFVSGKLRLDDYINSSGRLPQVAADGIISTQELITLGLQPLEGEFINAKKTVDDFIASLASIPGNTTRMVTPTLPRNPNRPGGYAAGANFIVPAGFPNDSFPMRVSSGERVSVTPAGRGGNMPPINITQSFSGAQAEPEKYKAIMYEVITDVIEQAMRQ